jgi:hypothetical protein
VRASEFEPIFRGSADDNPAKMKIHRVFIGRIWQLLIARSADEKTLLLRLEESLKILGEQQGVAVKESLELAKRQFSFQS